MVSSFAVEEEAESLGAMAAAAIACEFGAAAAGQCDLLLARLAAWPRQLCPPRAGGARGPARPSGVQSRAYTSRPRS